MAQRDYENQPEAPDLGASVQLDSDEQLVGPSGTDPLDAGYVPPDRPYGLDADGVTGREMSEGEPVGRRLDRELPDQPVDIDPDRSGRLTAAGTDPADLAGLPGGGEVDVRDVGVDGGAASAEEAAMHMSDGPGAPVEVEPSVADLPALDDPELERVLEDDDPQADRARREALRDAERDGGGVIRGEPAERIDADPGSAGSAAPASGTTDAGVDIDHLR